jgi:hypothetical protein
MMIEVIKWKKLISPVWFARHLQRLTALMVFAKRARGERALRVPDAVVDVVGPSARMMSKSEP